MRTVGLLGGSFNPAHAGHLYVSRQAFKNLGLSEIWWMVSPQNPLKSRREMAPFDERMKSAKSIARDPRIKVTDIERRLGTRYTAHSLRALKSKFPRTKFVWLMGADNLIEIPHWEEWTEIFKGVPIAVFNRPTYSLRAVNSKAAQRFSRYRLPSRRARDLARSAPPVWTFLTIPPHPASATSIREARAARHRKPKRANTGIMKTRAAKTRKPKTNKTERRTKRRK